MKRKPENNSEKNLRNRYGYIKVRCASAPAMLSYLKSLENCLKEFTNDILIAYGVGGRNQKIDSDRLNWPDLETTFHKAQILLGYEKKQ